MTLFLGIEGSVDDYISVTSLYRLTVRSFMTRRNTLQDIQDSSVAPLAEACTFNKRDHLEVNIDRYKEPTFRHQKPHAGGYNWQVKY